jgi:hypothetical protein
VDFVEKGAIVLAGLLLARLARKQITDVALRGDRVDYFVAGRRGERRWLLEVSGTDEGDWRERFAEKRAQLLDSRLLRPPWSLGGFVAVTRFAPPAVSILEEVRSS